MRGKRLMIGRDQWCTLPTMHHVIGPHVVDDRNARHLGQRRAIAELHSQTFKGAMQYCLSMKTNYINTILADLVIATRS